MYKAAVSYLFLCFGVLVISFLSVAICWAPSAPLQNFVFPRQSTCSQSTVHSPNPSQQTTKSVTLAERGAGCAGEQPLRFSRQVLRGILRAWHASPSLDCESVFYLVSCLVAFELHTLHAPKSMVHESSAGVHEAPEWSSAPTRLSSWLAWRASHPWSYRLAVWKFLGFWIGKVFSTPEDGFCFVDIWVGSFQDRIAQSIWFFKDAFWKFWI